ncbi:MAG: hypothetical protein IPP48_14185 [Chitinophagaceae bacterium]|nr:hypothetical protein [Chitinophagaceae bacterium]
MTNNYYSDVVMNIDQTESTIQLGNAWSVNSQTQAVFLINLFTLGMISPVWKTNINLSSAMDLTLGSKQSAKRFIEKKVVEKVILK